MMQAPSLTPSPIAFQALGGDQPESLKKVVQLYMEVFGAPPWNEGFIHRETGELKPLNEADEVKDSPDWKPFYNPEALIGDFQRNYERDAYALITGSTRDRVIGICNGWASSIEDLNEEKFKLTEQEIGQLIAKTRERFSDFQFENCFYLAEMAIHPDYQGQ